MTYEYFYHLVTQVQLLYSLLTLTLTAVSEFVINFTPQVLNMFCRLSANKMDNSEASIAPTINQLQLMHVDQLPTTSVKAPM